VAAFTLWRSDLRIIDTASRKVVWAPNEDEWPQFSPDGKWLATVSGSECRLRRVGTWQLDRRISGDPNLGDAWEPAFSPDGRVLAISYLTRVVRLIEVSTGNELATLTAPTPLVGYHLQFSPDGSQLAVVSQTHVIQLWDLRLIRT